MGIPIVELKLFFDVFEQLNEGIVITDINKKIIYTNKSFSQITGYPANEVLGRDHSILKYDLSGYDFYSNIWEIVKNKGHWQGEVSGRGKDGSRYTEWLSISPIFEEKSTHPHYYVGIMSDIAQRKTMGKRIEYLAQFDSLTGLPNKNLLIDRLKQSISLTKRYGHKLALLYIDIDKFKTINESLGHNVGDLVLQYASEKFKSVVRESDTVSRFSKDRFIVLLTKLNNLENIKLVIDKIIGSFHSPAEINNYSLSITVSIGVSIYPDDSKTLFSLMKNAEAALYSAKEKLKNTYSFYTEEINVLSKNDVELAGSIRDAIKENAFVIHYQPIVSFVSGEIIAAEALIRWQHKNLGLIPPLEFIPLAENMGLIKPIGEWVIKEVCKQINEWKKDGFPLVPISVNISPIHFQDKYLKDFIELHLMEKDLDSSVIELEVTETAILRDTTTSILIIKALKEMKIKLSIDDFGMGYTNLNYLKRLPINKLKIDRSFVSNMIEDPEDAIIIRTIVKLAKDLGLSTIAEGVETEEQFKELQITGCDGYQGFYFSKPVEAKDFAILYKKNIKK